MRFLFKAHSTKLSKKAFFTKSAPIKIIKTCASYSKRTVQNCKYEPLEYCNWTLFSSTRLNKIIIGRGSFFNENVEFLIGGEFFGLLKDLVFILNPTLDYCYFLSQYNRIE